MIHTAVVNRLGFFVIRQTNVEITNAKMLYPHTRRDDSL